MANDATVKKGINALGAKAAYNLANVTKTKPQYGALTPKWLTKFLEFKGLETGIFRVNKVVEGDTPLDVLCSQTKKSDIIPEGYVEYETEPREYVLNSISTIINVNTAVEDVYSVPYDQVQEQLGLAIESLRERQESQLINHPRAIAAFERECTKRGVPPVVVNIAGGTFLTWRGIPILPTDKLLVDGLKNPKSESGKTNILLIRTGEAKRGVIGLFQAGLKNEHSRGLSVRFRGIDDKGVASYLLSLYCSAAILADDAIAVLEDVEVGEYYDYD